jgi:hypothetical protein
MADTRLTWPRAEDLRPRLHNRWLTLFVGKAQNGITEDLELEDQLMQTPKNLLYDLID